MSPVNGYSSRFLKSRDSNGIRYVLVSSRFLEASKCCCVQFTITSAPEDPYVSVHVRQVGDWTYALGDRLGVGPSVVAGMTKAAMKGAEKDDDTGFTRGEFVELDAAAAAVTLPKVRIDGPYGAPAEDVFKGQVAILVGAGIGVTPFASILKHIWWRQKRGTLGALRRVEFFWVCRDTPSFGWFQTLLQEVESAQADRTCRFSRESMKLTFHISKLPTDQYLLDAENRRGHDVQYRRKRRGSGIRSSYTLEIQDDFRQA